MEIPIEPIQIIQMTLSEAFELFKILELEYEQEETFKENKEKINFGINEEFYIINYLNDNYAKKPKQQIILIERKQIAYKDFYEEINKRTALIKKTLLEYIETPDIITSR